MRSVDYLWNQRSATLTAQTVAFWAYLDRVAAGRQWSAVTGNEIGELYVRSHAEGSRPSRAVLAPYLERVDAEGWIHPASVRLLELWRDELRLLGVGDPGLTADRPMALSTDETLDILAERDLLVDHRRFGGPVLLDGPRWGLPLRQLVGPDGHPNYLVPILRDLIPRARHAERVVLVHDTELTQDYTTLDRVLGTLGATVSRLALGRVPIGGAIRSSRHGDWTGVTLDHISRACLEHVELPVYQLGMRIYFIAVLQRGSRRSVEPELLRRCLWKARRILSRVEQSGDTGAAAATALLTKLCDDRGYVDPYGLTCRLLSRRRRTSAGPLLREVYL
ncbi:hypothetical protein FHU28_003115 [Micromonospora echinospora]|uniref:Uncharacterized protein n=1 Tax=Micromonospora echinospora TaxID=1877 RepID=A0ABR6MD16_MICEC|nr:hypothetical protein [Micromonospora echinospora]MBB5113276.1 hypothetical protein [Micromonospora echinospora]